MPIGTMIFISFGFHKNKQIEELNHLNTCKNNSLGCQLYL